MSASNGGEPKGSSSASHLRPRHQITRSISELSPIHLHRHHHHNHTGHHQSGSHSRRDKQERASERDDQLQHARTAGSSAIFQPRTSLEVPRWEGPDSLTPGTLSPDQSRRTSALIASGDEQMGAMPEAGAEATLYTRKLSRDEELQEERRRAAVRASGLKTSLADLGDFSNTTTRRLDDTYYSVLEKLGMLQHTIVALKELAGMSQETSARFEKDSEDIATEMMGQIKSFGGFDAQERRIQDLTARIHGGRDKVKALSERVDAVRDRIEAWERADREWQERTRRRLKAIWVVTSVLLALVLVLLVAAQYIPVSAEGDSGGVNATSALRGRQIDPHAHSDLHTGLGGVLGASLNRTSHGGGTFDKRLRVFDEL